MSELNKFRKEREKNINLMGKDRKLQESGLQLLSDGSKYNYSFNYDWLSRPIIQHPQDIVAFQEIVWSVQPDLIIEMGIAHGGSLILSASLLAMLDLCEYGHATLKPHQDHPRKVIAVDIDIRKHNRKAIEEHPLAPRIKLIEGSSIDQSIINQVKQEAAGYKKILVCLDSNHTHEHVLAELKAYASLTSIGSYCIVFDTVIEDMPKELFQDRPWGPGNSPKTAVWEFLKNNLDFEIDKSIQDKLLMTVAPDGWLLKK
jgi:cephalosporin hydroxylase